MESLWMRLGLLFVGFLGMLGPLVLLMGRLRFREHRESVLLGAVLKELNSPDLRGLFAVNVRCGLFTRQDTISVDLQDSRSAPWWYPYDGAFQVFMKKAFGLLYARDARTSPAARTCSPTSRQGRQETPPAARRPLESR